MIQTGTVLNGRYEIVRLIAEGGMGAVYEGRDQKFGGGPVAIKRCLMTGEAMQRAFTREAELLANLSHPGVAKARDLFAEADGQYLVMEYIPGDDLEQLLQERGGPISTEIALEWTDQVLDALCYMHGRRPPVIHRDIKPSNLKLTPSGHLMLIDFGLAKGNGTTSLAGYSVNFAPLEQLQGEGTDPRSDLYALGATMYRLLTGRAPESALDRVKLIAKYQQDPLVSAHLVNPQVPESVAEVIREAMAIDVEDRLGSAFEMRERLRQAGRELALNYALASAPTQCDLFTEKLAEPGSAFARARATFPPTEKLLSASAGRTGGASVGRTPSQAMAGQAVRSTVVTPPSEQGVVDAVQAAPRRAARKSLLASCCVVALLALSVGGYGYKTWRGGQEPQPQPQFVASQFLPAAEPPRIEPSPEPSKSVVAAVSSENGADDSASREGAKRRREAAAREAELQRQAAALREANRLQEEAAAREREKQKQEMAALELEKQKAAWEAEKLRQQAAAREAERQKQEVATRELEKQKAAWEAARQKSAREAEKQIAALEAERQKAARENERQKQEAAARAAELAKQKEKAEIAARKAEKDAKDAKKQQKKREDEKKEAHSGVRVGVSFLGGIIGNRRRP
ncbi:MAG: protein kinase [Blastocatellia bacterium]|nr:protein kinase [Blastocatellia bacterium]